MESKFNKNFRLINIQEIKDSYEDENIPTSNNENVALLEEFLFSFLLFIQQNFCPLLKILRSQPPPLDFTLL